jgi:hypothetical protein
LHATLMEAVMGSSDGSAAENGPEPFGFLKGSGGAER